jgi:lipid-A-disaccharide synthase
MLETTERLRDMHPDLQILLSQASTIKPEILKELLKAYPWVHPIPGDYYALLAYSSAALVASGTATLETACAGLPFALVYRVSPLSFAIGKRVVKIPYIGLVNIIAGEAIIPEYLQDQVHPDNLVPELESLLYDENRRQTMISRLAQVRGKLGLPGASEATARLIIEQMNVHQTETI